MSKVIKRTLIAVAAVVIALVLIIGGYVAYVALNYSRIGDVDLDVAGTDPTASLQIGEEYQALTWNIGFGAYASDYSFFMDESTLRKDVEGVGKSGDTITGTASTAQSKESALRLTNGVIESVEEISGNTGIDFLLMQEADTDSHRSFKVNQVDMITAARVKENPQSVFANNFHTVWLQYPVLAPIGDIQSGLLTMSKYPITNAKRYGYTVNESFPTKFFDLDRCFSASYVPIEKSDQQLVFVNSHMTAYSSSNDIRTQQMKELMAFAQGEYNKGNYVIIGGDFNQVIGSDPERGLTNWQNAEEIPTWVGTLEVDFLGDDFAAVAASNEFEVSTCRDASFPYMPGESFEVVVDGFIVSKNVHAASENIQKDYLYSDHNPVRLSFKLLDPQN